MKKVEINVYEFHELSNKAKKRALQDWINTGDTVFNNEYEDTINAFCKVFPVKYTSYEYSPGAWVNFKMTCDDVISELSGIRLRTYIINNYYDNLYKPKFMCISPITVNSKTRYSNCQVSNDCPLTGYGIDMDILQPIYDFLAKPDNSTFKDLIDGCLQSWAQACRDDYEGTLTEEWYADMCEANSYTFLENGELYNI